MRSNATEGILGSTRKVRELGPTTAVMSSGGYLKSRVHRREEPRCLLHGLGCSLGAVFSVEGLTRPQTRASRCGGADWARSASKSRPSSCLTAADSGLAGQSDHWSLALARQCGAPCDPSQAPHQPYIALQASASESWACRQSGTVVRSPDCSPRHLALPYAMATIQGCVRCKIHCGNGAAEEERWKAVTGRGGRSVCVCAGEVCKVCVSHCPQTHCHSASCVLARHMGLARWRPMLTSAEPRGPHVPSAGPPSSALSSPHLTACTLGSQQPRSGTKGHSARC
jgi:hypothetical protein